MQLMCLFSDLFCRIALSEIGSYREQEQWTDVTDVF